MINGRLKQKLESAGGYFICLQFLALWFPWCCTGMLANLRDIFPNNEAGNLALMLVWSLFLTMVYLDDVDEFTKGVLLFYNPRLMDSELGSGRARLFAAQGHVR